MDLGPEIAAGGFFLFWSAASYSIWRLWLDTLRLDTNYLDAALVAGLAVVFGLGARKYAIE